MVLGLSALAWGVLTVLSGMLPGLISRTAAATVALLVALRFLLGATEASTYPVAARAVHQWMHPECRGFGSSLLLMGSSVASASTAPFVSWSMLRFGWRASFYLTSVVAFVIALLWLSFTQAPPALEQPAPVAASRRQAGRWLNTNVVLLSLSYVSEGYLLFMFVSWLYIYLVEVRGFSLANRGLVAALPWLAAIAATLLGGFLSDRIAVRFGRIASARILIMTGYTSSGVLLLAGALVPVRPLAVLALCISLGALYLAESFLLDDSCLDLRQRCRRGRRLHEYDRHPGRHCSPIAVPELNAAIHPPYSILLDQGRNDAGRGFLCRALVGPGETPCEVCACGLMLPGFPERMASPDKARLKVGP